VNVDELFGQLEDRNVHLYLDANLLRYRAPAGALTDQLREGITSHRSEIVTRLAASPRPRCTSCELRHWVDAPPKDGRIRTTCGVCGRFIGYRPVNLLEDGARTR